MKLARCARARKGIWRNNRQAGGDRLADSYAGHPPRRTRERAMTSMALTKLDVLDTLDEIKILRGI